MKTNTFENTIRRKLESIQPDFQEADWAKMQNLMHAHTPPTFWQQYSSWIGYAAAASVTTVMAFLYVNQLSQNDNLVADVKNLKSQIEVIRQQPAPAPDTVYLVQAPTDSENAEYVAVKSQASSPQRFVRHVKKHTPAESGLAIHSNRRISEVNDQVSNAPNLTALSSQAAQPELAQNSAEIPASPANEASYLADNQLINDVSAGENSPLQLVGLSEKAPIGVNNSSLLSRKMNYGLASRLSARQIYKITRFNHDQIASVAAGEKKVEKTAKADNVIPKFNIKAPYRFGGGVQLEGSGTAKTVVGEVLVGKKFSITAGISWLKVKPMEFLTDKIFKEKIRKDFRRSHPGEVPLALDVYNIKVNPTLVQIPLTVAFRNNLKDNWAYYAGVGTNVTLTSREKVSFDCAAPNKGYFTKEFDKKTNTPVISSANLSMGIEKTWHPIVVQAEGYLYTYFTPLTPLSHSAGPGVKLKLLYQIGGKM